MAEKEKSKTVTIDVLVEGNGGELVFAPVKASKDDFKELLEISKNPLIRENLKRELKRKKVEI